MKKLLCIALLACAAADAQAPSPPVAHAAETASATPPPAAPAADPPAGADERAPEAGDVIKSVAKVADDYKTGGVWAAVAAALALLMQLSKVPLLRKLLDDRGLGWVRPVVVIAVSAIGGVVAMLQSGAKPGPALLAGALAGVTGVGLREVTKLISPAERARVNVDVDTVSAASKALREKLENHAESVSNEAVANTQAKLATINDLPERQKLEALAKMLEASPMTPPTLVKREAT